MLHYSCTVSLKSREDVDVFSASLLRVAIFLYGVSHTWYVVVPMFTRVAIFLYGVYHTWYAVVPITSHVYIFLYGV